MMKQKQLKLMILLLSAIAAADTHAQAGSIRCIFRTTGERFYIVTRYGADYIQWGSGSLQKIQSEFKRPYLYATQIAEESTFTMVVNTSTLQGYGEISKYDGTHLSSKLYCKVE